MDKEKQLGLAQLIAKLLKPKPAPPPEAAGVRAEVKKAPSETKTTPELQRATAEPKQEEVKKSVETEVVRQTFIQVAAKEGRPLTAAEKMSVLLSQELRVDAGIENPALVGCISRLEGVNWTEPTADTWTNVVSILGTRIDNLTPQERVVLREIRQAAGEYYYRHKDAFVAAGVREQAVNDNALFEGVAERMVEDDGLLQQEILYIRDAATTLHTQNTQEWADDVSDQILKQSKHAPRPEMTVDPDTAQEKIAENVRNESLKWLFEGGEVPDDPQIAQIVYHVVTAPETVRNTKEFKLTKGSQLSRLESTDMTDDQRRELNLFRNRFRAEVLKDYGFTEDPRPAQGGKGTPEEVRRYQSIYHELSGRESGMPMARGAGRGAGGPGPKIWDRTPTGNDKLDELLSDIQNQFDRDPDYARNPRYLAGTYDRLTKFGADLDAAGGPDKKIDALLQPYKQSILEPWNNFSVNPFAQELVILYPNSSMDNLLSQNDILMDFWPEGPFAQAQERELAKLAELQSSPEYGQKVEEYMLAHKTEIEAAGYPPIDPANIISHEFYISRVKSLKDVYDKVNIRVAMQRAYGARRSPLPLEKQQEIVGNFGDRGVMYVKAEHGGINHLAYEFYNKMLYHMHNNFFHGAEQRIAAEEIRLAQRLTEDYVLNNKTVLEPIYQLSLDKEIDIPGAPKINRELTRDVAKKIAREVSMLSTITGAEESAILMAQSPGEAGQNGQSTGYSATGGWELALRGRSFFRWWEGRWDLATEGSPWQHIRYEADMYAKELRIDKKFDRIMEEIKAKSHGNYRNDPEYKALLEFTFDISERDPGRRAGIERDRLRLMFSKTLDGKNRRPPKSLSEVTPELLKEAYLFKSGINAAEATTGAYGYEESYMYSNEVLTMAAYTFGRGTPDSPVLGDLIGIEHRVRVAYMSLIGAETELELEQAIEGLIGDHGALRLENEYMPQRGFETLMKHRHVGTRVAFRKEIAEGKWTGKFPGVTLTEDRWDIAAREIEKRYLMIDALNAGEGLKPFNYRHRDQNDPRALVNVTKACNAMGIAGENNTKNFLDVMEMLSVHGEQESVLHDRVQGDYLDSGRIISGESSYIKYLDKPLEAPGNILIHLPSEEQRLRMKNFSEQAGGHFGQGQYCILGRWNGDSGTATRNAIEVKFPIHGATTEKEFLELFPNLMKFSLFTGGQIPKNRIGAITAASWLKSIGTDWDKDIFLLNNQPNSSPQKRAVGDQGLSVGKNEAHHLWEKMQSVAKVKWSNRIPELNGELEKQLGFIWKIPKPWGGHWEPIAPVWMYRLYLFGLLGLIIAAVQAKQDAQRGFSEGSGGGTPQQSHP